MRCRGVRVRSPPSACDLRGVLLRLASVAHSLHQLKPLRDRVLFLKHNLNARAIGALKGELVSVVTNVDSLIAQLDQSINEADTFISEMNVGGA